MNALANRGIPIQNSLCTLCGVLDESADHVLVRCMFAHMVRQRLFWRMKVPTGRKFDSVGELLQSVNGLGLSSHKRKVIHAVYLLALWRVLFWRNQRTEVHRYTQLLKKKANIVRLVKA
ncbi:hypothetical protein HanRHA438_Chr11g0517121 [Helianthus annuus]|uniref:Reverse transcriptase zinc-binding domain-containing protein n=1 Tax=Helianthus annuus TaxID=4232 RepID=A0A9K3HR80_HELAN|nr:hypothetical protein HanXRQr2_Chr11g0504551 [Helianthus annuus]KAJ0871851.1 hypothetical protein HanRHA438_Chr11g0517121 [Helianthus annuus]